MITRERLQELIKQGATCYRCYSNGYIAEIYLNVENFVIAKDCPLLIETEEDRALESHYLNNLFETKERAEWHCKMTAERTERFEPPMWEDIENYYRFVFVNYENGYWEEYSFELLKEQDDKAKDGGYISIWIVDNDIYYRNTATKENYIKACEIVRDFFNKGGA